MNAPATAVANRRSIAPTYAPESAAAPWSIYSVLFASTSVILGVIWEGRVMTGAFALVVR